MSNEVKIWFHIVRIRPKWTDSFGSYLVIWGAQSLTPTLFLVLADTLRASLLKGAAQQGAPWPGRPLGLRVATQRFYTGIEDAIIMSMTTCFAARALFPVPCASITKARPVRPDRADGTPARPQTAAR